MKMEDIFLNEIALLNKEIPSDFLPKRYAIATNIICCLKKDNTEFILMFNSDPKLNNTWYPFYTTINDYFDFNSIKAGDLISEFQQLIFNKVAKSNVDHTVAEFLKQTGQEKLGLKNLNKNEYWLKYSRSSNTWTMYLFEYYIATEVVKANKLLAGQNDYQKLIPVDFLNDKDIGSKKFDNVPVVGNIVQLFQQDEVLKYIKKHALKAI